MRIPYPTRIAPLHSATFAVTLCTIQLLEGTQLYFSVATFLFIVIATLAFNAAGGLSRPSGGYVFFYSFLVVILGLLFKAFYGEAADTNLFAPRTTIEVYVASISAMYVAVLVARRLTPKKPLLDNLTIPETWGSASVACMVVGIAITVLYSFALQSGTEDLNGSLLSVLRRLNNFSALGIILGTLHTVRISGGRRVLSYPVFLAATFMVLWDGIINSSKQGLFTPILCILLAAAVSRYNFSLRQISVAALGLFISVVYLVPFIQIAKHIDGGLKSHWDYAVTYLTNPAGVAEERDQTVSDSYDDTDDFFVHYYNQPHGFADRLEMFAIDDPLIDVTDRGHVFGTYPTIFAFVNLIPRAIWPSKPAYEFGNMYRHEIGDTHYQRNGQDDTTTGISISPAADAYHQARWLGVFLIAPALWFSAFFLLDWLCGDTRKAPWGLLAILFAAHTAPEGGVPGIVGLMTYGLLSIYAVSFCSATIFPIIGNILLGGGKQRKRSTTSRRPERSKIQVSRSTTPNQVP